MGQVGAELRRVRAGRRRRCPRRGRPALDRHPVRGRRRHHPQRVPGLHRRRHLRPGPRVERRPGLVGLRGLRIGRPGHQQRPGPDPRRAVRRGPGGRGRHHPQGVLRTGGRRSQGRPGLAPVPPVGCHQSDLLRALRPAPDGAVRRHRSRLRGGEGQERQARPGEPQCPLPQAGHRRGGARLPDGGRPAPAARDLRDLRRRGGPGARQHGLRPAVCRDRRPGHHRRRLHRDPAVPPDRHRDAQFLHRLGHSCRHRRADLQALGGTGRLRGGGHQPRGRRHGGGLRPLLGPRARLVRGHRSVQGGGGRTTAPRR